MDKTLKKSKEKKFYKLKNFKKSIIIQRYKNK